jgi:hypothetical protein
MAPTALRKLYIMTARYAVLLKVHYWNDFAERRLRHLLEKAGSGEVYLFVDETHGAVGPIAHDKVIRATQATMAELNVALEPPESVFWYNVDYPLYYFFLQNRTYDYYLMCEHDAVLNIDIDEFVEAAHRDRVDYAGLPSAEIGWPLQTGEGVYPESFTLHQWLNCLSLHSRRSVEFLLERRQLLSRRYAAREIATWPNNEVFIPTEMFNNGFNVRSLADFGNVDRYNWWPPTLEDDVPLLQDQAFLHPVLDERKYLTSCLRFSDLLSYKSLAKNSQLRRLLDRWTPYSLAPIFFKELVRQAVRRFMPTFLLDAIPSTQNAANFRRLLRQSTK